ncbi:MAG: hypothetical protein NTW16_04745 [Bacteroidetes bacterium]|nr:hypothetical protein [Bacteroidota bacterium]
MESQCCSSLYTLSGIMIMVLTIVSISLIIAYLIVNFQNISTQLTLRNIQNSLIQLWHSLKLFLKYFGWYYLLLVLILIIAQWFFSNVFPYILIGVIVLFFLYKPLKLVYMLIGAKSSLSTFLMLLIATQLLFAWAYHAYLPGNYTYPELVFNTFSTSLTQGPSIIFNDYLNANKAWDVYGNIFILLNTQIFISWIYLGVLIAGLYQKLRNE